MKENIKIILGIVIAVILSSTIAVTATTLLKASSVSYDNTTVDVALDNLFDVADLQGQIDSLKKDLATANTTITSLQTDLATANSTIASLQTDLANLKATISFDTIYPVGSIYMSLSDDTVAKVQARFGGTWVKLENRFLIGASTTYAAGSTGGSTTNTHNHYTNVSFDNNMLYITGTGNSPGTRVLTISNGITVSGLTSVTRVRQDSTYNTEISILNPYLAVYMYRRTK
jgi:hypothetical protein